LCSPPLAVSRPVGAAGQTLTLDCSALSSQPGARATEAMLDLQLRKQPGRPAPPAAAYEPLGLSQLPVVGARQWSCYG
jgi:hypothetical protein